MDVYLLIIHVIMAIIRTSEACGSYIKIGSGDTRTLSSGSPYGTYLHCLWWIETDTGSQLSLNITSYEGDYNYGRCGDYIIISNSDTEGILDSRSNSTGNCTSLTNHLVTASASWLRVQFYSDGITSTSGFTGHISSTYVGSSITDVANPIVACKSFELECSNKVCMTLSYRCDGFNDCGCDKDCDESGCEGLSLGKYEIMLIGGLMGLALFMSFFIFAFWYESYLRRKTLMADPEAQAELQRKKAEEKRKAAYKKAAKEKKGRR
ncbi:uncharacterized protein LOC132732219 isoform X2 [Ruditapes philippinarum]|uniref:uncharacterized protein LOC132732219 isoform X2 n=1 Tax=Ruditapes philippinarum TaxID=129788 RepID=UPI00295B360A|nr:uncharacterized protein LOC132732219 isoform X2 [Ruditapes philippinarum]